MVYADKEQEREYLTYFLRARHSAVGELLSYVENESPDFSCRRPNGSLVGIEHAKIIYNPERTQILNACREYDPESDNFEIFCDGAVALRFGLLPVAPNCDGDCQRI